MEKEDIVVECARFVDSLITAAGMPVEPGDRGSRAQVNESRVHWQPSYWVGSSLMSMVQLIVVPKLLRPVTSPKLPHFYPSPAVTTSEHYSGRFPTPTRREACHTTSEQERQPRHSLLEGHAPPQPPTPAEATQK
ncbi:hypothetical protein V6N12_064590 [Hibiscus sabdariffa]|uniref:Uncharacterized protein n=1 Tax=Hibiscus sabdariffa TaxID=183260 RepID=A0ABR2G751_9ROSI